jgi:hypothetical protein
VLESTPIEEPEKKEAVLSLIPPECLSTYTFMLTTIPRRIAVMFEKIKSSIASSGK